MQHSLRTDTDQQIQTLELSYFEDQSTGNLLTVLNDDVNQLERFVDNGALEIIQEGTTLFLIGITFFVGCLLLKKGVLKDEESVRTCEQP